MSLQIQTEFANPFIDHSLFSAVQKDAVTAYHKVCDAHRKMISPLGWFSLPADYDQEEFARILAAADDIRKKCDVFIVIGIGGSYLGARAAIEFLQGPFHNQKRACGPEIYFAGTSVDGDYLADLADLCADKDVCVNVISKSGTTTEPAIAFRVFRTMLEKKYGKDGAKDRIYVTTDKENKPGTLKEMAVREGYACFTVPRNIGGRYSVLSAVGLLPIAVSGADITRIMQGAASAMRDFSTDDPEKNLPIRYAALRNYFYQNGKKLELYASYSPALELMGEWLKQLFGESEGKDGKGIFPVSAIYSRDLHSLGQYVQQGERTIFETVIKICRSCFAFQIPASADNVDGLAYVQNKTMDFVNDNAMLGTAQAHLDGGVPTIILSVEKKDEEHFGYLVYFFELACAVSGMLLGVDPFDQPGVEAYKKNMFRLLGKPGYEK